MHALVVTYSLRDGSSAEHAELCHQLAPSFAAVDGLVSQTCLSNGLSGRYGAFYVFESRSAFGTFVASELYGSIVSRSEVHDVTADDFAVALVTAGERRSHVV